MARAWEKPKSNTAPAIDELGKIREQIKAAESREKELVEIIKAMGEGEHKGERCKAIVSTVETARLDTTGLKEALPEEMIKRFTKISESVRVAIKPVF